MFSHFVIYLFIYLFHRVTDSHDITSEERLLGSSTRKPKVTVFDASLGKNCLFSPQGGGGGRARRPHALGRAVAGVDVGGRGTRREVGAGKATLECRDSRATRSSGHRERYFSSRVGEKIRSA